MDKVWFILPLYNETEIIDVLYERLIKTIEKIGCDYELIFIDDKWKVSPLHKLLTLQKKDPKVKIIEFSRNFWRECAIKAGMDVVDSNYIVMMDADLQDPPELVDDMYKKIKQWNDVVYAKRFKKAKGDWIFKNSATYFFYKILSKLTNLHIPEDTADFRIFTREVNNEVKNLNEQSRFMRWLFAWVWFKQDFVLYERWDRAAGETGHGFRKLMKLALDGVFAFSDKPLRVATIFWTIFSLLWFMLWLVFLILRFTNPNMYVSGITTLIIFLFIIWGIQLIILWIIWEYIGRIYKETKQRPLYIIKKIYK